MVRIRVRISFELELLKSGISSNDLPVPWLFTASTSSFVAATLFSKRAVRNANDVAFIEVIVSEGYHVGSDNHVVFETVL